MNTNIFYSLVLWGLVLFFSLSVLLLIHPASRSWMLESRDLPSKPSRISSALSNLIGLIFYPILCLIKSILRILD